MKGLESISARHSPANSSMRRAARLTSIPLELPKATSQFEQGPQELCDTISVHIHSIAIGIGAIGPIALDAVGFGNGKPIEMVAISSMQEHQAALVFCKPLVEEGVDNFEITVEIEEEG